MKNYKYIINKKEIIVDEKEHRTIQDIVNKGGGLARLRNGLMGFQTSMITMFSETEDMTDMEENERQNLLATPPELRPRQEIKRLNGMSNGFKKILDDESFKECAMCKEKHYIPEDKELCIICLKKVINN